MPQQPSLTPEERLRLIKRVIDNGENVSNVAKEANISPKRLYRWLNRYRQVGNSPEAFTQYMLRGGDYWESNPQIKDALFQIVTTHPEYGYRAITKELQTKVGKSGDIGANRVSAFLHDMHLDTGEQRLTYAKAQGALEINVSHPGIKTFLSAGEKTALIKRVLAGETIVSVCKEAGIAESIFRVWLKRYKTNGGDPNALESNRTYARGSEHYAYVPEAPGHILSIVSEHPEYGAARIGLEIEHKLGKRLVHRATIERLLQDMHLSTYDERAVYASTQRPVAPDITAREAAQQHNHILSLTKQFLFTAFLSFLFFFAGSLVFDTIFKAASIAARIGMFFSFTALFCGMLFFLYSLKYYFTIAVILSYSRAERGKTELSGWRGFLSRIFGISIEIENEQSTPSLIQPGISLEYDLSAIQLERNPFVSIHVATYNEKRVIDRFLLAATAIEYDNYEVIVADDSTDETVQLLEQWKSHPKVKISHRQTRDGYKGGALKQALTLTDPRAEYILVFDADFIPYPDAITQFLKYFKAACGSLTSSGSPIAAVQGYQWHVLNKSENWITRGVRTEYSGSYVIERSGTEIYRGLKQISGSVYMIRKDVLQTIGWGTSITEDFELTLRLYEKGYKVLYTPYIQAPAEAVSTIKRLIRQRMRWAEGHSYNVKRMFAKLLFSPQLSGSEKFEFLYLSPYYLQAFFFLLGTFSWFTAEVILQTRLPYWTEVWGWSLVLTNLFALPLMNLVGLFLENSTERDYLGLISFIVLSYIVAPFQAFAAVKGFLEKEEGPWFRTPKTGRITDSFMPGRFYRFVKGILGKPALSPNMKLSVFSENPYLALASANKEFDAKILQRRKGIRWQSKSVLAVFLIVTTMLNYLALFPLAPKSQAAWYNSNYTYKKQITINHTQVSALPNFDASTTNSGSNVASLNWSHTTTTNANRLLLVGVAVNHKATSITSITYGGVNLTKIGVQNITTGRGRTEMWYLVNPATGANNVIVTPSTSESLVAGAATYYNVDQNTPLGTFNTSTGNSTASSVTVTTTANQLVMDAFNGDGDHGNWSPNSPQTQLWYISTSSNAGGSYVTGSAGTTTMNWTNNSSGDHWADLAVPINGVLSNFPLLVSETSDNDLRTTGNGGYVTNASGYDIIFVDSTETTMLDHEIEKYVASTGEIEMWVRIPMLSSVSDTVIYMYYDNSSISTSQENKTGVWDSNYKGVWHLKETSGNQNDSTSNGNNSTTVNVTTQGSAAGKIDGADNLTSGSSNYIQVNGLMGSSSNITISGWANASNADNELISLGDHVAIDISNANTYGSFYHGSYTNTYSSIASTGGWHYFTYVMNDAAKTQTIYIDGTQKGQTTVNASITYTGLGANTFFGKGYGAANYLTGTIDEPRVSSTVRSAGWIATEYNNQNSPSTFYSVGSALQVPENLLLFLPFMLFLPKIIESIKKRRKLRLAMRQHTVVNSKISSFARKKTIRVTKERFPDTS